MDINSDHDFIIFVSSKVVPGSRVRTCNIAHEIKGHHLTILLLCAVREGDQCLQTNLQSFNLFDALAG
jgi:hypothetical protein